MSAGHARVAMAVTELDPKAKQILLTAHWRSTGWRDAGDRAVSPAEQAYARKHRMMFPRETFGHDALVARIRAARAALTLRQVTDAFLASLSTRRLDLRSGLGSYAISSHLVPHTFRDPLNNVWCEECQGTRHNKDLDLDVLNFERHKWGGVRHSWPTYQYLDLRELAHALPATPEPEDLAIWSQILRAIERTPKADGPGKLEKRLADVLPSSKNERQQLLEILALAGVLVPAQERSSPGEWQWSGMWRGADGYDRAQVEKLFGARMKKSAPKKRPAAGARKRSSPSGARNKRKSAPARATRSTSRSRRTS